jgi:hypothetical protein
MAGTEMKNAVLIALVVLVILFVIYQYDPSFFGIFSSYEGFADSQSNGSGPGKMAESSDSSKAGMLKSNGMAQKDQNSKAKSVNAVQPGNPQNNGTYGNNLKAESALKAPSVQGIQGGVDLKALGSKKATESFADLSDYEGPASFGAAEAPAGCYPRDQLTPSELLPRDMNSIWAEQNPMGPGSLKGKNFLSAGALIGVNTVGQSLRNANLQIRSEPPNPQVAVSIFNQSTIQPDISHRPLEVGP